jgi:hypothetical protein
MVTLPKERNMSAFGKLLLTVLCVALSAGFASTKIINGTLYGHTRCV